ARYLGHDQRVVVQVLPGLKELPPAPPTPVPAKNVASTVQSAEPWRNQLPKPKALAATPLPAAKRFQLPNGLAVYVVESHSLPVVTAQFAVRAGSSSDPPGAPGLAGYMLAMLDEGAGKRDALGIARDLEALGTGVGSDMGRDGCSLSMRMLKRNATAAFGDWKPAGAAAAPRQAPMAPARERVLIADKPGTPQTTLLVAQIGVARSDPDFETLDAMNQVLGGLFSSRINMNLREAHGYTYGAFSALQEYRDPAPFTIGADVRTDVTGASVKEIMKEADGMVSGPVTADELSRAKESIARTLPAYFQSSASTANTVGQLFL